MQGVALEWLTHPLPRGGTDCLQVRRLASKVGIRTWKQSVPPRGSGG
jgi:hypothetical protein